MHVIYIHKIYRNRNLSTRFAHMNGLWKAKTLRLLIYFYRVKNIENSSTEANSFNNSLTHVEKYHQCHYQKLCVSIDRRSILQMCVRMSQSAQCGRGHHSLTINL